MSNGLNKQINVGFLSDQSSSWLGGINYYKNLFIALSKVDNPKIIPYIYNPTDENAKILLNWAKSFKKNKKGLKYQIKKVLHFIQGKKFDKQKYLSENANLNVISHSNCVLGKPSISWIPDFQHMHLPEMFAEDELFHRKSHYTHLAANSNIIIVSSNNALNDFRNFAPQFAYKARVLHFVAIPDNDIYQKTDLMKQETIKKYNLPEKYFYLPNQFWKHKNHKIVIEAVAILKQHDKDIKVVFTGNTSDYRHIRHYEELQSFIKSNNLSENIIELGIVDLLEVYFLMLNCISIINPSLFEGWSSTVEEAKSLGKSIMLSNIDVHKEQDPPGAIYFDPKNSRELADMLAQQWDSDKDDSELKEKAKNSLEDRVIAFGKEYQKILLEVI